jgi:outer membrane protein assembly factor BamB
MNRINVRRGPLSALATAVVVLWLLLPAAAAPPAPSSTATLAIGNRDWPGWRGPSHDGHAAAKQAVPLTWSDTENMVWAADVPGRGSSSPTVVGDRVYLTSCDEPTGSQSVYAFDRGTGKLVWSKQVHTKGAMRKHERSTGASSSVTCDGERLFVAFPNSDAVVITALSLDGKEVWQTKLCEYLIHQGYGASPFLYKDTVLVSADHKGGGAVAALDRRAGNIVWKQQRPPTPNYSSPVVFHLFGRDQLILIGCDKVISYDPATGDTLWEREGSTTECVTTPVTDGERVFSSGGYPRNHIAAVRADGTAKIDWENGEREYVPSLIHHAGHLYGVLDAGIAVCWESATGKEKWKQRLGGNFSGSPVLLDDTIFVTNESGQTHIFRAMPERFESLGVNQLGDEAWTTPVICGDRLYFRIATGSGDTRKEKLVCVGKP